MEKRFIFSDLSEAKAVLGMKDEFLKTIQKEFPDCRIASRGDEVIIVGSEPGVSQVETVLRTLRYLYRENTYMTTQHVRYSSSLIKQGKEDLLQSIYGDTVSISARGRLIKPKTAGQKQYVDSIRKNLVTFGIGPAGTGKTYLAVAKAVRAFQDRRIRRIILTRPAVEAGENLGFLPGTLNDKVDPYLRPLYDALSDMLGPDQLHRYLDDGTIEVAPLAYMRGRTLNDAYVILDEAQNTTEQQMKMFLTRLGFNTTMIITGDVTQVDLAVPRSGLATIEGILGGIDDIAFAHLDAGDVVRHELVGRIVEAYDRHDATRVRRNRGKESREDAR